MVAGWVTAVTRLAGGVSDAERVDRIRLLEELKNAATAAQMVETVALRASVVADEARAGVPVAKRGRGVGAMVGLARRESARAGDRFVGLSVVVAGELPHVMAALTRGVCSEWQATLVCRETACLSRQGRGEVDRRLAPVVGMVSTRGLVAAARRGACEVDSRAVVEWAARAVEDRRVTIRPAPESMVCVSALLPMVQGVAVFAALSREADTLRAGGDARSRAQVMADTLIMRVTGQAAADRTPVEVQVVMTDTALFGHDATPGDVRGAGPVPAGAVRDWLAGLGEEARVWVRRLYACPDTGRLVAMESTRRVFPAALRAFLIARDQVCRTPWCGAPIRHADHVRPARDGGTTTAGNGQGLCERCNQVKETHGWLTTIGPDGTVVTTTPTRHRYLSPIPPLIPPATTGQPARDTRHSVGDVRPSVSDVRPGMGDVRPDVGDARPSVSDVHPGMGDVHPDVGDMRPSVGDVRPGKGDMPPSLEGVPASVGDVPASVGDVPASVGVVRPGVEAVPSIVGDENPSGGAVPPIGGDERHRVANVRHDVAGVPTRVGDVPPDSGDGRPGVRDERPSLGDMLYGGGAMPPIVGDERQRVGDEHTRTLGTRPTRDEPSRPITILADALTRTIPPRRPTPTPSRDEVPHDRALQPFTLHHPRIAVTIDLDAA